MPLQRLFLNGFDLSTLGLWCALPLGWGDTPSVTDQMVKVPGHAGGMLISLEADIASREVVVEGVIHAPTGDLRAKWDQVKAILASPVLELSFVEWPDRYGLVRYKAVEFRPLAGLSPNYGAGFLLRFLMPNPYLLAKQVDIYTQNLGGHALLVLGSAPSPVTLYMIGNGSTLPSVAYLDTAGTQRGLLKFDLGAVLAVDDWIEFDGTTLEMLWHKVSGAVVNAVPFLHSSTQLFVADPQDGDLTVGPILVPTACNMIAHVRKCWL